MGLLMQAACGVHPFFLPPKGMATAVPRIAFIIILC